MTEVGIPTTLDPPFMAPSPTPTKRQQEIIDAYLRHKSVWKAAEEVRLCGQRVHQILVLLGYRLKAPEFTKQQLEQIRDYYQSTPADFFDLSTLSKSLGKSRQNIARAARKMGLTKQGRSPSAATLAKTKGIPRWRDKPHPRGMAGKRHTAAAKAATSAGLKVTWATQKTFGGPLVSEERSRGLSQRARLMQAARGAQHNYSRTKSGARADLGGLFVRSSWEANYARYLNMLMKMGVVEKWDYEPETFWFEGIRRGVTSYRPDFRVKYKGDDRLEYIEIKGWIVPKDHTKWKRMKKYHPSIKLVIVKSKEYYSLQKKWATAIPQWEHAAKRSAS